MSPLFFKMVYYILYKTNSILYNWVYIKSAISLSYVQKYSFLINNK